MTKDKKPKSKRLTMRHQHKIHKKSRDHQKKMKRVAKNMPRQNSKLKKDPGVPNLWPFKKELLEQVQKKRAEQKEEDQKKRLERKKEQQRQLKKDGSSINNDVLQGDEGDEVEMTDASSSKRQMAKMQFDAVQRFQEYDAKKTLMAGDADEEDGFYRPLHQSALSQASKRAYYREFKKVVEASDVIIEVLDARDPLGCRCFDIEKNILSTHPDKKIVLLMNKIDLVPREVAQKWLTYLRRELPTVAFKSNTQMKHGQKFSRKDEAMDAARANELLRHSSSCLGATSLIQLLKNYARSADIKRNITVGIIGYPNVGKSSVINSLRRSKVVGVGATPGMTKMVQEIQLDSHIKLLDCPGIVFSSTNNLDSDIILRNAVRIEQLDDPVSPVDQVLQRCKPERLMQKYGLPPFESTEHFLTLLCKSRGFLRSGGKPRLEFAARTILKDWVSGRIPFFTLPPERTEDVVQQFNNDNFTVDDSDLNKIATVQERMSDNFIPMIASSAPKSLDVDVESSGNDDDDEEMEGDEFFEDSDNDDDIDEDSEDDE